LAASPAAKGLFHRAISESGGSFGPARTANEGGATVPSLQVAETTGRAFFTRLGASDLKAARAVPADKIQASLGAGLQSGFWPVFDGEVLPGDEYGLYQTRRFNDTPVLIGTNSDEGITFVPGQAQPAAFESAIRAAYGAKADTILAAYPHATVAEATQSARNIFRDATFAWHTWAWATLQSKYGRGKAYVYYF